MAPKPGYGRKDEDRLQREQLPLSGTGGSHGVVYRSDKQKKDGTYTRYIHIYKADRDPHFVADYSAITSELLRFVSTDVFPKVRVITRENFANWKRESVGYISAEIQGYQTANDLIANDSAKFNSLFMDADKKRQLAALFVGAYFTAENDLHGGNWGVDSHGNIKKIDNDQALFHHTAGYKGLSGAYIYEKTFTHFPNLIFPREKAFELTAHDIEKLPILDFAKPANWPSDDKRILEQLKILSQDPDFKKYKWQYFTKLLLVKDYQLKDICDAHTLDDPEKQKLYSELLNRKAKLREALLICPEYREFLLSKKEGDENLNFLRSELRFYNKQFESKGRIINPQTHVVIAEPGDIKPKYHDRIFFDAVDIDKQLDNVLRDFISDAEKITSKEYLKLRYQEIENAGEEHLQAYDCLVGDIIRIDGQPCSSSEILGEIIYNPTPQLEKQIEIYLQDKYRHMAIDYFNKMYRDKYNQLYDYINMGKLESSTDIRDIATRYAQAKYDDLLVKILPIYKELAEQIKNMNTEGSFYELQLELIEKDERLKLLSIEHEEIISLFKSLLKLSPDTTNYLTQESLIDFIGQKIEELSDADKIAVSHKLMEKLKAVALKKQDLMAQIANNQAELVDLRKSLKLPESLPTPEQPKPVQRVATRQFQAASSAPSSMAQPTSAGELFTPLTKVRSEPDAQTKDIPIPPRGSSPKGRG